VQAARDERGRPDGEVVWSWPPDAGVKLVDLLHERRGLSSPDPGESTIQALTPLRRECRIVRRTCGDLLVCFFHFAHKAAGAIVAPAFPAPSSCEGERAKPGPHLPRERKVAPVRRRHRERSDAMTVRAV